MIREIIFGELILISIGLVLTIASVSTAFDESSDASKAFDARFVEARKAFVAKDVRVFESTFTLDFKSKRRANQLLHGQNCSRISKLK